jgi:small-conductance mechanosensitive channel
MVSIKNIIIGLIIAVVFVMFCAYGTNLLYKSPNYENYCRIPNTPVENQTLCDEYNGTWIPQETLCKMDQPCPQGYCDYYTKCQPSWQKAEKAYSQNLFIISIVVALIVIAIAAFLISVSSVSGGLMFGSLMYLIYGTARYWGYMEDWGRFIILGVALIVLIYIGYRLASREKEK